MLRLPCGNALYPILDVDEVREFEAFADYEEIIRQSKKSKVRNTHGDFLHGKPRSILTPDSGKVVACFGALFQGDHLGVEVATDSHVALMKSAGLLSEERRLQSGVPLVYDDVCSGLIIDDFFVISREAVQDRKVLERSAAVRELTVAKGLYRREGLIGSDDKDVLGDVCFKVCGAEVHSSYDSVEAGGCQCGSSL